MPPKKRQNAKPIEQAASNEYKKKLRPLKSKPQPSLPKLFEKECQQYTIKSPYPQSYVYPNAIISYTARNPENLNDHENFIKSAKSLLRASRIIPVKAIQNYKDNENQWMADKQRFSLTEKSFDLWITKELWIFPSNPYFTSNLLKRIYRCSLENLTLFEQILTLKEVQFLVDGGEMEFVRFVETIIKNDADESTVKFEKLFTALLASRKMIIILPLQQHGFGKDTATKMIEALENRKISHSIELINIPENFHFAPFACFLKTNLTGNQHIKHSVYLHFCDTISDAFKNQLQTFVYEIIAMCEQNSSLKGKKVPVIKFFGHDEAAYLKLRRLRDPFYHRQLATKRVRRR